MIRPLTKLYTAWRDNSGEATSFSKRHGRFDIQLANQQEKKDSTSFINDMLEMSRFSMQVSMNRMVKEDMEQNLYRPQAPQMAPQMAPHGSSVAVAINGDGFGPPPKSQ